MLNNINEIKAFLDKYPSPKIRVITTIKDGYVSCIGPVKTICGPELHVSANTKLELWDLMVEPKGE